MKAKEKNKTVDFGAPEKFGAHVFRVEIPDAKDGRVRIVEDYGYHGLEGGIPRDEERVVLARRVWSAIAATARNEALRLIDKAINEVVSYAPDET